MIKKSRTIIKKNVSVWNIFRGDAKILNEVQDRFDVNISELPDEIDLSSYSEFHSKKLELFYNFTNFLSKH